MLTANRTQEQEPSATPTALRPQPAKVCLPQSLLGRPSLLGRRLHWQRCRCPSLPVVAVVCLSNL